ncbi:MAG: FG-GAP repeat protein [Candidatus Syntrophosphaera sp.]|nr:FG-GAP repeat protein [Candidatus Syntrophosphaera sp.]
MSTSKKLAALFAAMLFAVALFGQRDMPIIAELVGEHNGACFGWSVITLDFNHDGYDDLAIFSAGYGWEYPSTPSRGKVYIYYGGPGFNSNTPPAVTLEGDYPNGTSRVINSIENVGDVNGDGFDDLMIEDFTPYVSDSIRFMFYYGNTDDLSAPDRIEIPPPGEHFGQMFKLGDVDGDGYGDIGVYYIDYVGHNGRSYGIFWGGSFERQFVFGNDNILSYATGINGIGDIDNDGYDDFAIGYRRGGTGSTEYDVIRLFNGNPDRSFTEHLILRNSSSGSTRICEPLGDLNADGYADFLGYSDYTSGRIRLWYGSEAIDPNTPSVELRPDYVEQRMEGVGYGDFNNDGYDDVVCATYYLRRMAVWLGGDPMNGFDDWSVYYNIYDKFGYSVATGDYNADGFCDIAISAPEFDSYWPEPGRVFIFGGHSEMTANDDPTAPGGEDHFSLRLSPNPVGRDGTIDLTIRGCDSKPNQTLKIEIFDIRGRRVYLSEGDKFTGGTFHKSLQLRDLASGVYICRVKLGNLVISAKISMIK